MKFIALLILCSCASVPEYDNEYEDEDLITMLEMADTQDVVLTKKKKKQ